MTFRLPLLSLGLALALGACGDKAPEPKADVTPPVEAVKVIQDRIEGELTLQAQIEPWEQVDIYPRVSGFISDMRVDRGSRVGRGAVLLTISAPDLVARRAEAAAQLRSAQARVGEAQAAAGAEAQTAARLANAARTPGVVAENEVNTARAAAAAARARVAGAAETVAGARQALSGIDQLSGYLTVRAPFAGVITERNLDEGALVGPSTGGSGEPILRLVSLGRLRIVVPVPEDAARGVHPGQEIAFSVPGMPGERFTGVVARSSGAIDRASRTMTVELDVPNGDARLQPGGFANVTWPARRDTATLVVPTTAVANDQQRQFVIRVRDGKAEWVDVTTGRTQNGKTEVFGEVKPGDTVLLRATDGIRDGSTIRTVAAKPPAKMP